MNINEDIVPSTLDESVELLFESLEPNDIIYLKRENPNWHFGWGRWLRNNWSLWEDGTPLVHWFNVIGIYHADDMTAIIMSKLICKIKGEAFDLDKEVETYREHWRSMGLDPDKLLTKG